MSLLIHLKPTLFTHEKDIELLDFRIDDFDLTLKGGEDLKIGRPCANKAYNVACRANSRKHLLGFLIEVSEYRKSFSALTRWRARNRLYSHTVTYVLYDSDLDAVTECMCHWTAAKGYGDAPTRTDRMPPHMKNLIPCHTEPKRNLYSPEDFVTMDVHQIFEMPTLTRERITDKWAQHMSSNRMPELDTAFKVDLSAPAFGDE
jgi:hypothetical protein